MPHISNVTIFTGSRATRHSTADLLRRNANSCERWRSSIESNLQGVEGCLPSKYSSIEAHSNNGLGFDSAFLWCEDLMNVYCFGFWLHLHNRPPIGNLHSMEQKGGCGYPLCSSCRKPIFLILFYWVFLEISGYRAQTMNVIVHFRNDCCYRWTMCFPIVLFVGRMWSQRGV